MYRGISDFNKGCHSRTNIIKNEKGDLVADSHNIMVSWRKYFSQLFNINEVNGVRQGEIHAAEPLVLEPAPLSFELVIVNFFPISCRKG